MRADRWPTRVLFLVIALGLAACASGGATTTPSPIAVSDVASLAGRWSGLLEMEGGRDREDYLEIIIDPNGAYRAASTRQIGLLDVRGTVAVTDGRIVFKGERGGQATGAMYTQPPPDTRLLIVNGAAAEGRRFAARLRPQR